jgi:DNA-damage-inducible protein J
MKTATLSMRLDPEVKDRAEALFSSLGMSLSEAMTVFLHKSLLEGGLPFEVREPRYNRQTEAAMEEARAITDGRLAAKAYGSVEEMRTDLNAG